MRLNKRLGLAVWGVLGWASACSNAASRGDSEPCDGALCRHSGISDASAPPEDGRPSVPTGGAGGSGMSAGGVGARGFGTGGFGAGGFGTGGLRVGAGGVGAGGFGTGGITPDGAAPTCTVALSEIPYCEPTYSAAFASVACPPNVVDPVSLGTCGKLHLFGFGHDGYTTCAYDASSGNLVGARSCGIPPLAVGTSCYCHVAGQLIGSSCPAPGHLACNRDAGAN